MSVYLILLAVPLLCAAILGIRLYIRHAVEKRITQYQNDLTQKHCEEVDNLYRQTRGWRHDIKNHLQTMQAYLEMGQTEQLERYLHDLTTDYNQVDIALKTGNTMVDAILNSKLSLLKTRDIQVDATALVPSSLPFSDVDLCVMIGNLLDNSLEACLKIPAEERFVRFYMSRAKGNLYLYVMNSTNGCYRREPGRYRSTKSAADHGYGLLRIDQVVRKYHGYQDRQDEGNVFATEILLPLSHNVSIPSP